MFDVKRLLRDIHGADLIERSVALSLHCGVLMIPICLHSIDRSFRGTLRPLRRGLAAASLVVAMPVALHAQLRSFDHHGFDGLLREHVARGMVDYDAFAGSVPFARYLGQLSAFDPAGLSRDDRLAFWINAYNAYTIQLVNSHRERRSIRNINKSFGFVRAFGPWRQKLAMVGGRAYSLDEIEQDIIRPQFGEPRIHFALVCAAMGCPPLRSEAYTGVRLAEQLEDQARRFILEAPTKNRVDVTTGTVFVSPIFIEFRDYIKDFGGTVQSVGRFLARYHPPGAARDLLLSGNYAMEKTSYDWQLNSQENERALARIPR